MKILHLNASSRGPESQSLAVAERIIAKLEEVQDAEVDRLNLFDGGLPAFDADAVAAKMAHFSGASMTEAQRAAWVQVKEIFRRFSEADVYVINTPLWNNSIPYVLKQFIDLVTQPGWTFSFDPAIGYRGLMTGKRAFVVHASGVYHAGIAPNFGSDFSTPYLTDWFNFIGVTHVEQIHVAPTVLSIDYPATKARAMAQAEALIIGAGV